MPPIGSVSTWGLVGLPPHLEMTGIRMKRVYKPLRIFFRWWIYALLVYGNHGSWSTPALIWKYCWFPRLIQLCPKTLANTHWLWPCYLAVAIYIAATVCQYQECEIRNLDWNPEYHSFLLCEIRNLEVAIVNLSPKNLRQTFALLAVFSLSSLPPNFTSECHEETVACFFARFFIGDSRI